MGQYVLSSFVQLYKIDKETPVYADYVAFSMRRYNNTLRKQLYLQNHGVSFDYTDKLSYHQIEDLINVCKEMDEEIESLKN